MTTIWKFPLDLANEQVVRVPKHSKLLKVGANPTGGICFWAMVDPKEDLEDWTFYVYGTGMVVDESIEWHDYLGSVAEGLFVWHVFGVDG